MTAVPVHSKTYRLLKLIEQIKQAKLALNPHNAKDRSLVLQYDHILEQIAEILKKHKWIK